MAITSGFFNSLNGDRKYDARQMGEMFDGLIEDGVFMSVGDALKTVPSSGMIVAVGTGRAWFLHTWTKNDSDHLITVSAAESVLNRIDTIVLDIDNTEATRDNDIVLVKGTPSSNPKRPTLIDADDHKQIPLADILVPAGSTALTATNITNIVGTSECPYVTGPLSIIKNDDILEAWQEEFDTWFDGVKGTLGSDTAGNLYNLIQQKVDKTSVLDTMDEIELTTEEGYVAGALAVKELNDNNKVYKYAITVKPYPASNPGNTLTINVYKQNRMCMGYVSWLGSVTNDTSIIGEFTVPEAFCPVYDVFFSSPVVTSGTILSHGSTRFILGTDGRLTFTTDEQGFLERRAAFAFLSNDIVPGDSYLQ